MTGRRLATADMRCPAIVAKHPVSLGLLTYVTLTLDRQKAQGPDGAQTILARPFGKFLLTAVALASRFRAGVA